MILSISVIRIILIKSFARELIYFTQQDTLVYMLYCNSPMLRSSPELPSPLEVCGYDILFAHFKGIKCLPPFPTLPYPQETTMWLPAENSSVALAAHLKADEKSLHSEIEISQRRVGSK